MVFLLKTIKPARFKDKEFKRVLRNAVRRAGRAVIREDYEAITEHWEHKPKIKLHTHVTARTPSPSFDIEVEGDVWKFVNKGTKPHMIWAGIYTGKSDKKSLAFGSSHTAKTTPGVIGSRPGGSSGETVFTPYVMHPGTEPREFDKAIAKKRLPWFKRLMEEAMREASRASGHSR